MHSAGTAACHKARCCCSSMNIRPQMTVCNNSLRTLIYCVAAPKPLTRTLLCCCRCVRTGSMT
jgi:hypothetical protein